MQVYGQRDTIAAIATPSGDGGIGVVRISGANAKKVLAKIWLGKPTAPDFETHKLYYGHVGLSGERIDSVLASWMCAPKTYTGEDVVEISGHGGRTVMKQILEACCIAGARLAEPGEFTKRAYLNGKVDLVQAEAVADIIAASSDEGLKQAREQLSGRLSQEINSIHNELKELRAFTEAAIDFPEEDIGFLEEEGILKKLKSIFNRTSNLAQTFDEGRMLREGVHVSILGKPNAGKSSLFNALAGDDRAIVHHVPGTTRDIVEEKICLGGITFYIRDTAGLCDAENEVEKIGIRLAREDAKKADIALYVVDGAVGLTKEDKRLIDDLPSEKKIVVYSKSDLACLKGRGDFLSVSSKTKEGLDDLKKSLVNRVKFEGKAESAGAVVTNARHKHQLDLALEKVEQAKNALVSKKPIECLAQDLRSAQDSLGLITGEVSNDALLDEIFSRFCIGK